MVEEKYRRKFARFVHLLILIGVVWMFSGPYYAAEVFTSENALRGSYLDSDFENDKTVMKSFNRIKEEVEQIDTTNDINGHFNYVKGWLGNRAEVHTQRLKSVGMQTKNNVYAYFRSKDGYGQECNVISAPLEYKPSIVYILTFLETLYLRQPHW